MLRAPRKLLLNDEGNSALHYIDLDVPSRGFTCEGPGRDLQLIGDGRVLRSTPAGYVELDLAKHGEIVRAAQPAGLPGAVESARRLASGHTLILGNSADGIFVWELAANDVAVPGRQLSFPGLEMGRLLRFGDEGTLLFCSDTAGKRLVHEASWEEGARTLIDLPSSVPAERIVKAVRVSPEVVMVSTGYAASLISVDTTRGQVVQTVGGKVQAQPERLRRPISPYFFSGFQSFANGDTLVANWQGHGQHHGAEGYQLLMYDRDGQLVWTFDQAEFPFISSVNNVIALDHLDVGELHDERGGVLVPIT